tara:strand:- start:569 stop:784 length:216 start_codon:yes stop_codon:yes gene_type:complete
MVSQIHIKLTLHYPLISDSVIKDPDNIRLFLIDPSVQAGALSVSILVLTWILISPIFLPPATTKVSLLVSP